MTRDELEKKVKEKADLYGANLSEADLSGANLYGANLDFITFQADGGHFSYFWNGIIKVGCESKTPQEWIEQADEMAENHEYSDQRKQKYIQFFKMCLEIQDEVTRSEKESKIDQK